MWWKKYMTSLKNKRILITGGAGSIGQELVRQLCVKNKIFILDTNETGAFDLTEELKQKGYWVHCRIGDVRQKETVHDVFSDFKPEVVFHAAAYKHVTPMEWYPEEAVSVNIQGTLNVVREAKKWETLEKFVYISTDKVVNAKSVMGASKLMGEIIVRNQDHRFVAVRFGNVMGSRGSVLPIWQGQMDRGEPLTVTDPKAERYMMSIPQAVTLIIEAAQKGTDGEIYILDMGERINVLSFAREIVERSNYHTKPVLPHTGGSGGGQIAVEGAPISIIGLRPGEALIEELMTEEEKKRAKKTGNFWIIQK